MSTMTIGADIPHNLTAPEITRYSRQLVLPQFGPAAQNRLKNASILIVGAGGLGTPAALYLAGAGVGTIALVDRPADVVDLSNLHRQIAYSTASLGVCKTAALAAALTALNPLVAVVAHSDVRFDAASACRLVAPHDVVLDCTDNVAARYVVGDACATLRKPLVSGAAVALSGQLMTLCLTERSPCYRCVFPSPPPPACVGSCEAAGVLGPVPGVIGTLQALEALKVVARFDGAEPLDSKLLLFDGATSGCRTVKMRSRMPDCIVCSEGSSFSVEKFDYEAFSSHTTSSVNGSKQPEHAAEPEPTLSEKRVTQLRLSVHQLASLREEKSLSQYALIDVRPPIEFDICHLAEAKSIPLSTLHAEQLAGEINASGVETILICRRGRASKRALLLLLDAGAANVRDVVGGLEAWHEQVDKRFPLY